MPNGGESSLQLTCNMKEKYELIIIQCYHSITYLGSIHVSGTDQLKPKDGKTIAETQLQSRKKAAKMLIAVVAMFGICYLPVHLLNILR